MKKKISRICAFALSAAMLLCQLPYVSAAGTDYCSVCKEHAVKGQLKRSIDATCKTAGFAIYDCDYVDDEGNECPGTITVKVAEPTDHTSDGNTVPGVPATCTETGTKAYELCTGCGCYLEPGTSNKLDTIVIPATGHFYTSVVTDPTCTEKGYTTHTCSVCKDSYVDNYVDALGHDFSVTVDAESATCKDEGHTAYIVCSRCNAEDPDHPKVVIPVQDHSLRLIDHQDPTCTEDGYNEFKCDEPTCPYSKPTKEVISKTGHDIVKYDKKAPTCDKIGYDAYEACTKCDYSTYNKDSEVPALGHTYVSVGYVAPTCTTQGYTDAIVCGREGCGLVHRAGGETIAPLGHTLVYVQAVPATCFENGNIAHKRCTVCEKLFATTVEDKNIDAVPLSNVVIPKRDHDPRETIIPPTCTEGGYKVYTCNYENCNHTYSEPIAAKGHDFEVVAKVEPKCGVKGKEQHKKCKTCGNLYAIDAATNSTTTVTDSDLEIPALDHVPVKVEYKQPTYNEPGNQEGTKCSLCDKPLEGAATIPELQENVRFHFDVKGIKNAATAVNSGYVTVNVYFDVLKDAAHLDSYNCEVLANIYGVDYTLSFDHTAFDLKTVTVAPGAFDNAAFTDIDNPENNNNANKTGIVKITQDIQSGKKVFKGENNLFATLVFLVEGDTDAADYTFENIDLKVVHSDGQDINTSATDSVETITVEKLGDANGDGQFDSNDTLLINSFVNTNTDPDKYVAKYDMDKDGEITYTDVELLRQAIVNNPTYLSTGLDEYKTAVPNSLIAQEVNQNAS